MYKIARNGKGYIDTVNNLSIPNDPGNRHYQQVQAWIAQGNTPEPEFTTEEAKAEARINLSMAMGRKIESNGVVLSVLGFDVLYPTKTTDQINMMGQVTKSRVNGPSREPYKVWCKDVATGVWARRGHTTQQIQDVGTAIADAISSMQDNYEAKLNAIDAGTDAAAILAITLD